MSQTRTHDQSLIRRITAAPEGNSRPVAEMDIGHGPSSPAATPHAKEFPALSMLGRMIFSPLAMVVAAVPVLRHLVDRRKWFGGR